MQKKYIPSHLANLLARGRIKTFPSEQIILYPGDTLHEVYILKSGTVKLYDIDENGKEKILHLLSSPLLLPLSFFSGDDTETRWYYSALTDCEVYVVPAILVRQLMRTDGEVASYMMSTFSQEVHEVLTRLESLEKSDITTKLVAALRYLTVCHGHKMTRSWWRVPFPVNHQLMADMTGVSRETASAAMKKLSDQGIVRNPRVTRLEINFSKLQAGFSP